MKRVVAIVVASAFGICAFWFVSCIDYTVICSTSSPNPILRNDGSVSLGVCKERTIFFHETSAASILNPRQACAVESAAKLNPNSRIYLFMTSNVDKGSKFLKLLTFYSNIYVNHINLEDYFQGSPLEELYNSGVLNNSKWPVSHMSDALRYLTLWKLGGTYLDLDVVVLKSLEGLSNYVGAETPSTVAAGVMNFELGHPLAAACIEDLVKNFKGNVWNNNGPGVITRVLKSECKVQRIPDMTRDKCGGFTVFPPYAFYPIPYWSWKLYFDEKKSNDTLSKLTWSYVAHMWNKLSAREKVKVGSNQPYSIIAQKNCPKVFSNCGKFM